MQLLKEKVMKRRRLTEVLSILGGLILAFVTFSTPSGWALDQVSLRLDWIGYTPHHIAFWIAKEKGWFAQEGIDVTIGSGRGSVQTAQLLISKKDPIGYMTGVELAQFVGKGAQLQMVAVYLPKALPSYRYLKKSGIRTPKDLEGRTVGLVTGGTQSSMWLPFAKAAGFDASKVKVVQVDQGSYNQLLLQGKIELSNGSVDGVSDILVERIEPIGQFALADYLPVIGHGLAVHKDTKESKPDMIRRFIRASSLGWRYLVTGGRKAAIEGGQVAAKNVPGAPEVDVIAEGFERLIPFMRSKNAEGRPLGWSSPKDWEAMLSFLQGLNMDEFKPIPKVEQVMTNALVPPE